MALRPVPVNVPPLTTTPRIVVDTAQLLPTTGIQVVDGAGNTGFLSNSMIVTTGTIATQDRHGKSTLSYKGPYDWMKEPNHTEWIDPETMMPCRIRRNMTLGCLCGYVASHRDLGETFQLRVAVHGGLTYREQAGEDDTFPGFWWYGFDCGHYSDYCPFVVLRPQGGQQNYRNWEYVTKEVTSLARQLRLL